MKIKPEEISSIIKKQIEDYKKRTDTAEVGTVIEAGDGIVRIYGLNNAVSGELLLFPNDIYGMALNLEEETVGACVFGEDKYIKEGTQVRLTGEVARVKVGDELIGRVLNGLGEPIDGKGPLKTKKTKPIEETAPGVVKRQPVKEPLQTGLKAVDSMIPIGCGQRELIIGDRQTGKTAMAVDTIINQRDKGIICIYVAIGGKNSSIARVVDTFEKYKAMDYTIVISASASDPTPLQYLAPYTGCAIGEFFRDNERHALIVYDDLTKHAKCYRELSLILRHPPGREAYPGDIFYCHSRLLERACKYADEYGAGSLTALPIIETQAGDVTTYIPTNVISITDGQIYLETNLFYQGVRPAVNVGLSVSRVGGQAQIKAMKQIAGSLRLELAQYREMEAFARFGTELDKATVGMLERGKRLVELLKQPQYRPIPVEEQILIVFAGVGGYIDNIAVEEVSRFEEELLKYVRENYSGLLSEIKTKKELSDDLKARLDDVLAEFRGKFISRGTGPH
ncbi:MAG: F0F1 ATP synthase subunit alpha [Candidatus Omnitrophota bacterium]|nr:MAG: F0F1 ATP synthase subunit alpha [Candidatus Omnitrophota bacterium]